MPRHRGHHAQQPVSRPPALNRTASNLENDEENDDNRNPRPNPNPNLGNDEENYDYPNPNPNLRNDEENDGDLLLNLSLLVSN